VWKLMTNTTTASVAAIVAAMIHMSRTSGSGLGDLEKADIGRATLSPAP
jgi:hypothetical protein